MKHLQNIIQEKYWGMSPNANIELNLSTMDFPEMENIQDAKTTEQNIEDEEASVVEIDYEKELRSIDFLNYLSSKQTLNNKSSNAENHISLKFFIDYLAKKDKVLRTSKYRTDIETAVIKVFGERYSTQTYWLLYELQKKAMDIRNQYHEEGVLQDEIAEN